LDKKEEQMEYQRKLCPFFVRLGKYESIIEWG
jgi:hypothetical protein